MSDKTRNKKTVLMLSTLVIGMFAFGFALVPLYGVICNALGIPTASTAVRSTATPSPTAEKRPVTVRLDTTVNNNLPWQFEPLTRRLDGSTGELLEARFRVSNLGDSDLYGQAIPSIIPWQATEYVQKIDCFCFDKQRLAAGESQEVVLRFIVSPDLPKRFHALTISYTYMNPENPLAAAAPASDGG
ncbi:MAG: cytochrome c oxidase assembly protein [Gammaproteobacteria bacterium]